MKKVLVTLFLILSVAGAVVIIHNEANAKDKPTLLYIYAPMCGACKQFESTFNSAMGKFSNKFNFVKEDINSSQRAQSLNVSETPSVFILQNNKSQRIGWDCLSNPSCFEQRLKNY